MSQSVSTDRLDDSRSTDNVLVVPAHILLFAIVPYTFDLLSSLRFIFFVDRISKDPTHVTNHSLTSLISVKMMFLQGNTISSNCIWWTAVVQCATKLRNHYYSDCPLYHRQILPPSASHHKSLTLRERSWTLEK